MTSIIRELTIRTFAKALVLGAAIAGVSGCAMTANGNPSSEAVANASNAVVFGKFRLVRNGHEMQFGDSIFANTATLTVYDARDGREINGKVGRDGQFAWALKPGTYHVSSVGFKYHGERVEPPTGFTFTVSPDHKATYVGTMMLEASFSAGQYGTNGTIDKYTVSNDCATDCASQLARLGLDADSTTTALFRWNNQIAQIN